MNRRYFITAILGTLLVPFLPKQESVEDTINRNLDKLELYQYQVDLLKEIYLQEEYSNIVEHDNGHWFIDRGQLAHNFLLEKHTDFLEKIFCNLSG